MQAIVTAMEIRIPKTPKINAILLFPLVRISPPRDKSESVTAMEGQIVPKNGTRQKKMPMSDNVKDATGKELCEASFV